MSVKEKEKLISDLLVEFYLKYGRNLIDIGKRKQIRVEYTQKMKELIEAEEAVPA